MDWDKVDLENLVINDLNKEQQLSLHDWIITHNKIKRQQWYLKQSKYMHEALAKKYIENPNFKKETYKKASISKRGKHQNISEEAKLNRNKKISEAYKNKSFKEKENFKNKISISQKARYANLTIEQKQQYGQIHRDSLLKRTLQDKKETILKIKTTWDNKPKTVKEAIYAKRREAIKATWNKKSPEEIKTLLSNRVKSSKSNIADDGERLDSSYEKIFYNYLINSNIKVSHNIPIKYQYRGYNKRTYIDFKVNNLLFECKGFHLLKGVFDYKGVPINIKLDIYKQNNVILITDKKGLEFCRQNKIKLNIILIDFFKCNIDWDIILDIIKRGGMNVI